MATHTWRVLTHPSSPPRRSAVPESRSEGVELALARPGFTGLTAIGHDVHQQVRLRVPAHLDLLHTGNYTTEVLGEAVRKRDLIPIEEDVHLMTDVQARLYGIRERGRVQEGWHADLVVLDESAVGTTPLQVRSDLPTGAPRLYSEGLGIDHVICNGEEIVRAGEFTDARPGAILRSGRDTANPSMD